MARADYCGNGISHTKDGTLIDVYDRLGIQQPETNSGLVFEAAWGIDGVLVLARTRYPDALSQLQRECPDKLKKIYLVEKRSLAYADAKEQIPKALIFNNSANLP